MVEQKVLKDLFTAFPSAIINRNIEFVADPNPRVNSYFRLEDCESREDVAAKILEWLSREAYKSEHYGTEWRNDAVHAYHHLGINSFCGTNFTKHDIMVIYTILGNGCDHQKTLEFIRSGFNMSVFREEVGN